MAVGDFPPDPRIPYKEGWIIGWLRDDDTHTIGSLYWAWWDGKAWGPLTEAKQYPFKAEADAVAVGLKLEDGEGEIRVQ